MPLRPADRLSDCKVKNKPKKPFVPDERLETVRKNIISILIEQPLSAKDISGAVRISEKAVNDHLQHIQKSVSRKGLTLIITPSECKKCGFVFEKREKLKKPSKCPECRNEAITEPVFSIKTI
ncbi:MAG: ArsR family transcriptional regulator [Nitrospirae bacterium]|nr:ArsR family transcriptional regulator [Nitrospirota bacterium]